MGIAYANLVGVYMDRKDYPAAEALCRKALQVYAESLPDDHPNPAIVHVKLGRTLLHQQRYAEAEPETKKGYLYFHSHGSPGSSYLIGARRDLIEIEDHLNKPEVVAELRSEIDSRKTPAP